MKTTIDIADNLLLQAKEIASSEKVTLKSLTEEGLRHVLGERMKRRPAKIKPVTVSGGGLREEFQSAGWNDIRAAAYGERGA